jgi:hypothetical protein
MFRPVQVLAGLQTGAFSRFSSGRGCTSCGKTIIRGHLSEARDLLFAGIQENADILVRT